MSSVSAISAPHQIAEPNRLMLCRVAMPCLSEFGREFGVESCHFVEGVIQFVEVTQKLVMLVA
jgi:hypothetical protein